MTLSNRNNEGPNYLVSVYHLLGKLQFSFLYLVGVFVMGFEHLKNIITAVKPVRVAASN